MRTDDCIAESYDSAVPGFPNLFSQSETGLSERRAIDARLEKVAASPVIVRPQSPVLLSPMARPFPRSMGASDAPKGPPFPPPPENPPGTPPKGPPFPPPPENPPGTPPKGPPFPPPPENPPGTPPKGPPFPPPPPKD